MTGEININSNSLLMFQLDNVMSKETRAAGNVYQQRNTEIPKTEIDMLLQPKNGGRIDIECNYQKFFSILYIFFCS
jgi:hypothetical protein